MNLYKVYTFPGPLDHIVKPVYVRLHNRTEQIKCYCKCELLTKKTFNYTHVQGNVLPIT